MNNMPPNNLEAERAALACVLIDSSRAVNLVNFLVPEDFYFQQHSYIFRAIRALHLKKIPIDIKIVASFLKDKGKLDEVGGVSYLAELTLEVPTSTYITQYIRIIKEKSALRKLIALGQKITEIGHTNTDVEDALHEAKKLLNEDIKFTTETDDIPFAHLAEGVKIMAAEIPPFTWGVENLDRVFSPFGRGRYVVLAGETNAGKTPFALQMAIENAKKGFRILYLSLEMSNEGLIYRYARERSGVTKKQVRTGDFDKEAIREVVVNLPPTLFAKKIGTGNINTTISSIANIIRYGKYDMVFIDNFGYIESEKGESMHETMAIISREMAQLKRSFNVTIVALHHFRKKGSNAGKIRNMDEMLGSIKISHDVDFVLQVLRDTELDPDSPPIRKAELTVAVSKDRDWGGFEIEKVYYKNGVFVSDF